MAKLSAGAFVLPSRWNTALNSQGYGFHACEKTFFPNWFRLRLKMQDLDTCKFLVKYSLAGALELIWQSRTQVTKHNTNYYPYPILNLNLTLALTLSS